MVPAYYDIDNEFRSDDDIADLKQVLDSLPHITHPCHIGAAHAFCNARVFVGLR